MQEIRGTYYKSLPTKDEQLCCSFFAASNPYNGMRIVCLGDVPKVPMHTPLCLEGDFQDGDFIVEKVKVDIPALRTYFKERLHLGDKKIDKIYQIWPKILTISLSDLEQMRSILKSEESASMVVTYISNVQYAFNELRKYRETFLSTWEIASLLKRGISLERLLNDQKRKVAKE